MVDYIQGYLDAKFKSRFPIEVKTDRNGTILLVEVKLNDIDSVNYSVPVGDSSKEMLAAHVWRNICYACPGGEE